MGTPEGSASPEGDATGDAWASVGRVFLPPPRAGTDVTPEPLEPPPLVGPSASASGPLVPAPPIVPGAHDVAAHASRAIDKHDASATSKFDVASLSSSRIDASEMSPVGAVPGAVDALAAADAAAERIPSSRDSAPFLPPPPNDRAAIKLPGVAPMVERGPATPDGQLAAPLAAAGAASAAWAADEMPRRVRGGLRSLIASPRRIAIAAGALVVVVAVIVFAFGGGDAKPSAGPPPMTPADNSSAGASDHSGATRDDTAGTKPDTAGTQSDDTSGAQPDTAGAQPDTVGTQPDTAGTQSDDTAGTQPDDTSGAQPDDTASALSDDTTGDRDHAAGVTPDKPDTRASTHRAAGTNPSSDTSHPSTHVTKPATKRLSTKPAIHKTTKPTVKKPRTKPTWNPDTLFPTRKKKK